MLDSTTRCRPGRSSPAQLGFQLHLGQAVRASSAARPDPSRWVVLPTTQPESFLWAFAPLFSPGAWEKRSILPHWDVPFSLVCLSTVLLRPCGHGVSSVTSGCNWRRGRAPGFTRGGRVLHRAWAGPLLMLSLGHKLPYRMVCLFKNVKCIHRYVRRSPQSVFAYFHRRRKKPHALQPPSPLPHCPAHPQAITHLFSV